MQGYPLIFTLTHDLQCAKFSARVVTRGRVLMRNEDGEWWCHGVEPGGITECGADPAGAFAAFKRALGRVYEDLIEDGEFEAFEARLRQFVSDADTAEAERWEAARMEIRNTQAVAEPFNQLPRVDSGFECGVTITDLSLEPGTDELGLAKAA